MEDDVIDFPDKAHIIEPCIQTLIYLIERNKDNKNIICK